MSEARTLETVMRKLSEANTGLLVLSVLSAYPSQKFQPKRATESYPIEQKTQNPCLTVYCSVDYYKT